MNDDIQRRDAGTHMGALNIRENMKRGTIEPYQKDMFMGDISRDPRGSNIDLPGSRVKDFGFSRS